MSLTKVSYSMVQGAVISILDHGANITLADNKPAIQSAINAASAAGGGCVEIPNGNFSILTSLVNKAGVCIRGNGWNSIISTPNDIKIFDQNTGLGPALNMVWDNFRIKGPATSYIPAKEAFHAINLFESQDVIISNMWFENTWGDGVYIRTHKVTVKNIHCKNCYRQGVALTLGDYITIDGVRGSGTMITLVDIEPNPGDQINYLVLNDIVFIDDTIPALRLYDGAATGDVINNLVISNITTRTLGISSATNLVATNLNILGSDSVNALDIFAVKNSALSNISISGGGAAAKLAIVSSENVAISNAVIVGGANVDIDCLGLTNCVFSSIRLKSVGNVGIRIRDSSGTTFTDTSVADANSAAFLLIPTSTLSKTVIRGALIENSNIGVSLNGTCNNVYIDGDFEGCTTPLYFDGSFVGVVSNGDLGSFRRNPISFSAPPTTGAWILGDIVWNSSPVSGGVPGWMCTSAGTPGTWKAMANLA